MKNKYHREQSKKAQSYLESTKNTKMSLEDMMKQLERHQRQAFEQDFGSIRDFKKGSVKMKRMDILQAADYALDFKSLSQFIPTGEDKQFHRSLFLMLRLGKYLRN